MRRRHHTFQFSPLIFPLNITHLIKKIKKVLLNFSHNQNNVYICIVYDVYVYARV